MSCEKEDISSIGFETSLQVEEEIPVTVDKKKEKENWTTFYNNGPNDYGCAGEPSDCAPPIIITYPEYKVTIDNFFDVVYNNNLNEIQSYVDSNFEDLNEFIETRDLNQLLSSELTLSAKPYNNKGKRFLIFSTKEDIVKVYPFK